MAVDKKEEKRREKAAEYKKYALLFLSDAEKLNEKLESEEKERKKEKLLKKIQGSKESVFANVNLFIRNGGDMADLLKEVNEFQMGVLEELLPGGTDTKSVETDREIRKIKELLDELKECMGKYSYDPEWPIEKKRRNKLFFKETYIGYVMRKASREKTSWGNPNPKYNASWNYIRDYESTKDKYFTPEEQELIARCMASTAEETEYLDGKRQWMYDLGAKISDAGHQFGEWGTLTAAKMLVKGLSEETFPGMVKEYYRELSEDELKAKGREMTREYVLFCRDEKAVEETLKRAEELEGSVPAHLGGEERELAVYTAMVNTFGPEKTAYVIVYRAEHDPQYNQSQPLSVYTVEELGL